MSAQRSCFIISKAQIAETRDVMLQYYHILCSGLVLECYQRWHSAASICSSYSVPFMMQPKHLHVIPAIYLFVCQWTSEGARQQNSYLPVRYQIVHQGGGTEVRELEDQSPTRWWNPLPWAITLPPCISRKLKLGAQTWNWNLAFRFGRLVPLQISLPLGLINCLLNPAFM